MVFLGPNGAGKTTLMKCMLTLSTITSGSIEIFGKKSTRTQRRNPKSDWEVLLNHQFFYDNCTAKEILEIHAQYMGEKLLLNQI